MKSALHIQRRGFLALFMIVLLFTASAFLFISGTLAVSSLTKFLTGMIKKSFEPSF